VRHNAEWFFFLVNLDVFEILLFGDRLVDLVLLAALDSPGCLYAGSGF
jgi:hypothetical protein